VSLPRIAIPKFDYCLIYIGLNNKFGLLSHIFLSILFFFFHFLLNNGRIRTILQEADHTNLFFMSLKVYVNRRIRRDIMQKQYGLIQKIH